MNYSTLTLRTKQFFKNDVYTYIVGLAIAVLIAGVPMTALAAEKPNASKKVQSEQVVSKAAKATKVNINTASASLLAAGLNGIGLKKAEAIVGWRTKNGKFTKVEQLMEVKGIGAKTLEKNRKSIVL